MKQEELFSLTLGSEALAGVGVEMLTGADAWLEVPWIESIISTSGWTAGVSTVPGVGMGEAAAEVATPPLPPVTVELGTISRAPIFIAT